MNRRDFVGGLAGLATAAFAGSAHAKVDGVSSSTLRIGTSQATSGIAEGVGRHLLRGMHVAFQQTNRTGGVYGRELELVALDDGYDPPRTVDNTRDLIGRGVFALGCYMGTPTTVAALPLIKEADIPVVGVFSGSGLLRSPALPQVFNVRASYQQEGRPIVKHLVEYGGESPRIGLFVQDDSYGQSVEASILSALKDRNLAPVAIARIPRGSDDVRAAVKLLRDKGVTAVALGSTYCYVPRILGAVST